MKVDRGGASSGTSGSKKNGSASEKGRKARDDAEREAGKARGQQQEAQRAADEAKRARSAAAARQAEEKARRAHQAAQQASERAQGANQCAQQALDQARDEARQARGPGRTDAQNALASTQQSAGRASQAAQQASEAAQGAATAMSEARAARLRGEGSSFIGPPTSGSQGTQAGGQNSLRAGNALGTPFSGAGAGARLAAGARGATGASSTGSTSVPAQVREQLAQAYDQLPPAQREQVSRQEFIAQGAQEYGVATDAREEASRKVDAEINAALSDFGPNSVQARTLMASRGRVIEQAVMGAVESHRMDQAAQTMVADFAADPDKWRQVSAQYGLPAGTQPTQAAVKDILTFDQKLLVKVDVAGDAAVKALPPGASPADAEAARAQAETRTRLEALVARGGIQVPARVDTKAWVAEQARLAGEEAKVRLGAVRAGQDPAQAVATNAQLFSQRLDAQLRSGELQLPEGVTPEQVKAFKDEQVKQFHEAVELSDKLDIPLEDAQARIHEAYRIQGRRIDAQVGINQMVQEYNASTTAVQRGGERLRGLLYGDGVNHLDWARTEIGDIEQLEQRYHSLLLKTDRPLNAAEQQELDGLRQQIEGRIDLATTNVGLNVQHSLAQAARFRPVESVLFGTVYAASSVIPGGVAIGAATKLLLDDLPNGRIRNNGNVLETSQDVVISLALGASNVAINKFDPTKGRLGTAIGGISNSTLRTAATVLADAGANGLQAAGASVVEQWRDPAREGKIDWAQVSMDTAAAMGGSAIGRATNFSPAMGPTSSSALRGESWRAMLGQAGREGVVAAANSTVVDVGIQLATTGQVDWRQTMEAATVAATTAGLSSSPQGLSTVAPGQHGNPNLVDQSLAQAQAVARYLKLDTNPSARALSALGLKATEFTQNSYAVAQRVLGNPGTSSTTRGDLTADWWAQRIRRNGQSLPVEQQLRVQAESSPAVRQHLIDRGNELITARRLPASTDPLTVGIQEEVSLRSSLPHEHNLAWSSDGALPARGQPGGVRQSDATAGTDYNNFVLKPGMTDTRRAAFNGPPDAPRDLPGQLSAVVMDEFKTLQHYSELRFFADKPRESWPAHLRSSVPETFDPKLVRQGDAALVPGERFTVNVEHRGVVQQLELTLDPTLMQGLRANDPSAIQALDADLQRQFAAQLPTATAVPLDSARVQAAYGQGSGTPQSPLRPAHLQVGLQAQGEGSPFGRPGALTNITGNVDGATPRIRVLGLDGQGQVAEEYVVGNHRYYDGGLMNYLSSDGSWKAPLHDVLAGGGGPLGRAPVSLAGETRPASVALADQLGTAHYDALVDAIPETHTTLTFTKADQARLELEGPGNVFTLNAKVEELGLRSSADKRFSADDLYTMAIALHTGTERATPLNLSSYGDLDPVMMPVPQDLRDTLMDPRKPLTPEDGARVLASFLLLGRDKRLSTERASMLRSLSSAAGPAELTLSRLAGWMDPSLARVTGDPRGAVMSSRLNSQGATSLEEFTTARARDFYHDEVQVGITRTGTEDKVLDLRMTKGDTAITPESFEATVTRLREAMSLALDTSGPKWTPEHLWRALEENAWEAP